MYECRQTLMRLRQGDSEREIARSGLMGRAKAARFRTLAQGWIEPSSPEVLLKGGIGEPAGRLQTLTMLDPRPLDSPAAVIERPELFGRITLGVEQVGHQHADVAAGGRRESGAPGSVWAVSRRSKSRQRAARPAAPPARARPSAGNRRRSASPGGRHASKSPAPAAPGTPLSCCRHSRGRAPAGRGRHRVRPAPRTASGAQSRRPDAGSRAASEGAGRRAGTTPLQIRVPC